MTKNKKIKHSFMNESYKDDLKLIKKQRETIDKLIHTNYVLSKRIDVLATTVKAASELSDTQERIIRVLKSRLGGKNESANWKNWWAIRKYFQSW